MKRRTATARGRSRALILIIAPSLGRECLAVNGRQALTTGLVPSGTKRCQFPVPARGTYQIEIIADAALAPANRT